MLKEAQERLPDLKEVRNCWQARRANRCRAPMDKAFLSSAACVCVCVCVCVAVQELHKCICILLQITSLVV